MRSKKPDDSSKEQQPPKGFDCVIAQLMRDARGTPRNGSSANGTPINGTTNGTAMVNGTANAHHNGSPAPSVIGIVPGVTQEMEQQAAEPPAKPRHRWLWWRNATR